MSESLAQRIEQEQIIDAKYEQLAAEYARITGARNYMSVILRCIKAIKFILIMSLKD